MHEFRARGTLSAHVGETTYKPSAPLTHPQTKEERIRMTLPCSSFLVGVGSETSTRGVARILVGADR